MSTPHADREKSSPLAIREIGGFHAGGHIAGVTGKPLSRVRVARNGPDRVVDLNGDYITGQCYVQYARLEEPVHDVPVMFWHGGAMTGVTWETTPDGKPGWQMYFLRAGYDVFVCDAFERGRAGSSPYPEIYAGPPIYRTQNEAWSLFRMGPEDGYASDPAQRTAFDKQMFPLDAFDQLGAQFVPRWTSHGEETLAAYFRALEKVGPVVLISHSQGANFAMEAVQRHPEFFRCVVLIEPASAPVSNADKLRPAAKVPHLFVWGDFIDQSPLWRQYRQAVQRYMNDLLALGGQLAEMDLPALNICGNSHVPMMDRNSDQVAERIEAWIRETI